MTPEEKSDCFKMLDGYSRSRRRFFLAEMDLNVAKGVYALCFRPLDVSINSANRYACRYLYVSVEDLVIAAHAGSMPMSTSKMLDDELQELSALS